MKRSRVLSIFLVAFAVLGAGLAIRWVFKRAHPPSRLAIEEKQRDGACPGETNTVKMKDPYMPRSFPLGTQLQLVQNWYSCHQVERGDFVLHRYAFSRDPVVRRVVAVPGDRFELVRDEEHHAWNLRVNGGILMDGKSPHYFGSEAPPLLSLYQKSMKGVLPRKNFIIFSEISPGDFDSGTLGVVNEDDFVAKAERTR